MTRDICLSGAFLLSPTSPPAEATIQLDIFLPPLHNGAPRVRIQAEAQVVRVEPSFPDNYIEFRAKPYEQFLAMKAAKHAPKPFSYAARATA